MIPKLKLWLVDNRKDVVLFVVFFLVSVISFSLGYLVANQTERVPIIIEDNSAQL